MASNQQTPWQCMYCTRFFHTIDRYLAHKRRHKRWVYLTQSMVPHQAARMVRKLRQDNWHSSCKVTRYENDKRGETAEPESNEQSHSVSHKRCKNISQNGRKDGTQNSRKKKSRKQICRLRKVTPPKVLQLRVGDALEDLLNTGSFFMDDDFPKLVLVKVNAHNYGNQGLCKEALAANAKTSDSEQSIIHGSKTRKCKNHVQFVKKVISSKTKSKTSESEQSKIQGEKGRKHKKLVPFDSESSKTKSQISKLKQSKIQICEKTWKRKDKMHNDKHVKFVKGNLSKQKTKTVNAVLKSKRRRIGPSCKFCDDDHTIEGRCNAHGIKVPGKRRLGHSIEGIKGLPTGMSSKLTIGKISDSDKNKKHQVKLEKEQQLENDQRSSSTHRRCDLKNTCVEMKKERKHNLATGKIPRHSKSKAKMNIKGKPFKCTYCNKRFLYSNHKKSHEQIHAKKESFRCQICGKEFLRQADKTRHEDVHLETKPYKCKLCPKVFKTECVKTEHEKAHGEENRYQCTFCDMSFCYRSGKSRHELLMHKTKKSYQCKLCKKEFSRPDSVKDHVRIVHAKEKPYKCRTCETYFSDRRVLRRHEKLHGDEKRDHKCNYCCARFITHFHKIVHERTHTREKPLKCSICRKRFSDPSNLKAHERLHIDVKPYQCSICKKGFALASYRNLHEKIHTNEKSYQCRFCVKTFLRPASKKRHERIHSENKVYIRGPYNYKDERGHIKDEFMARKAVNDGLKPNSRATKKNA